jgi:hypothetical protein
VQPVDLVPDEPLLISRTTKASALWRSKSPERLALKLFCSFPLRETVCVSSSASNQLEAFSMLGEACYGPDNIRGRRVVKRFLHCADGFDPSVVNRKNFLDNLYQTAVKIGA